jgi:hypothetical protein
MDPKSWRDSKDPRAILSYLTDGTETWRKHHRVTERTLRLLTCAWCRQVWHLLVDDHSRNAVEVTERFADGLATADEFDEAHASVRDVDAGYHTFPWLAFYLTENRPQYALDSRREVIALTREAGVAPTTQADVIRDVFGSPFGQVSRVTGPSPLLTGVPGWLIPDHLINPLTVSLAESVYQERLPTGFLDPVKLSVLADCLTDQGIQERVRCHVCRGVGEVGQPNGKRFPDGSEQMTVDKCWHCWGEKVEPNPVLYHIRKRQCWSCQGKGNHLGAVSDRDNRTCETCWGTGSLGDKHVRGCWVIDLLTGRE